MLTERQCDGGSGAELTGRHGDMKRPDSMSGTLQVSIFGLAVSVPVVSVGGMFSVKLPTGSGFTSANPADYGFADPAKLIDPNNRPVLAAAQMPVAAGRE